MPLAFGRSAALRSNVSFCYNFRGDTCNCHVVGKTPVDKGVRPYGDIVAYPYPAAKYGTGINGDVVAYCGVAATTRPYGDMLVDAAIAPDGGLPGYYNT